MVSVAQAGEGEVDGLALGEGRPLVGADTYGCHNKVGSCFLADTISHRHNGHAESQPSTNKNTEDRRSTDMGRPTGQSVLKGETPYGTKRLWVKQPTGKTSYRTKHQTGQKFEYKTSYGDKM